MQHTVIRVRLILFSPSEYLLHLIRAEAAGEINEVLSFPLLRITPREEEFRISFVHHRNRAVNAAFSDSRDYKMSNSRTRIKCRVILSCQQINADDTIRSEGSVTYRFHIITCYKNYNVICWRRIGILYAATKGLQGL
ncbi:hypothetical protein CEXT_174841 [Caerostris extrusa]|uniref:Uncharacterized protein n=1 Tax=Caerostris extrusa TaxID=172846 RepID=A0AAV4U310_CAEEX|nr:hypothetical protein CEXT_174841 [Caerostris extrusa]